MDTATRNEIARILQNERYNETREKLHILLVEREIPFLSSTNDLKVLKQIGSGAFGVVDLVSYQEKIYAQKKPQYDVPKQQNGILEEAIRLTDINGCHSNIQRLYFINLRTFGFLMDYCGCGSLDVFITDKNSTYTFTDALNWGYQLADALSFLHSKNIMHRDVKMQNILLKDNYQTLVLTDYGTATDLGRSLLTNQAGTPVIMAPEVFTSTKYTEQCDVYSWAIVFWQLLAKEIDPYANQKLTWFGLLMKVSTEKLRPPKLNNCPDVLVALMYRSWHSDPNERPTLMFIKKVLRLLLNAIPEDKQKYSEEMVNEDKQWINDCDSSEKHLLNEPRLKNEKSVNIYQDCLNKVKRISDVKKNILELEEKLKIFSKENEMKSDHYDQLLNENQELQRNIEVLRAKKLH